MMIISAAGPGRGDQMKKSLCVLLIIIIFLVLTAGYVFSSSSPYIAIRKHLLMIDPVRAVTCSITPTALADFERGMPFIIYGFTDKWGFMVNTAYVKTNGIGLYYVYSLGGGPQILENEQGQ